MTYITGQRVTITRGQQKGASGEVAYVLGAQYVIKLDAGRTAESVTVKAPGLKAL
jgi:hypothetical protein